MKLTSKKLRQYDACTEGYIWFIINFPDGIEITKENITKAVEKLLKVKSVFWGSPDSIIYDTCNNLNWIIGSMSYYNTRHNIISASKWQFHDILIKHNYLNIPESNWNHASKTEIVNAVWTAVKDMI